MLTVVLADVYDGYDAPLAQHRTESRRVRQAWPEVDMIMNEEYPERSTLSALGSAILEDARHTTFDDYIYAKSSLPSRAASFPRRESAA